MRALLAVLLLLLPVPVVTAEDPVTVVVTIGADGLATVEGGALASEAPGASYVVDVVLEDAFALAEVRVHDDGVDVDRPRQFVPEYDDQAQHVDAGEHLHPHFFAEVFRDVAADDGSRVFNTTRTPTGFVHRLGLTGPGAARLILTRDVTPPAFVLGNITDVNHYGFVFRTTTDEFAFGDLRVRPAEGGEELVNPTAIPALEQTYPVQGLDADTAYVFSVVFTDWAGNEARSPEVSARTAPEPVRPRPTIVSVSPENASRHAAVERLEAVFTSPEPVEAGGVQFFFDKRPMPDVTIVADGPPAARWIASVDLSGPLQAGRHSAAVEVTNAAGGKAVERWSFEIGSPAPGPLATAALLAVAVAALVSRRR